MAGLRSLAWGLRLRFRPHLKVLAILDVGRLSLVLDCGRTLEHHVVVRAAALFEEGRTRALALAVVSKRYQLPSNYLDQQ